MLSGIFRFFASFGAKTRFEQSRIRATYYGDQSAPNQFDISVLLQAFANKDQQTRAQVAISLFFERLQSSSQRKEWVFVLKNLIIMDRCTQEHLMLHEIANYSNRYIEQYQSTSVNCNQLTNKFIQNYFAFIKAKAQIYNSKGKSVISQKKTLRSDLIDRLPISNLFQQIKICVQLQQQIFQLNEAYKNGNRQPEVIQYTFALLLSTLLALHSVQFRCINSLLIKSPSMDIGALGKIKEQLQRMDKSITKGIVVFLESNKGMEGFRGIMYKDFYRFGPKFTGFIEQLIRNAQLGRKSRVSEKQLQELEPTQLMGNSATDSSHIATSSVLRRIHKNKHFTEGSHRKDIHYTKGQDQDIFQEFQNGYSSGFTVAKQISEHLQLKKQSSSTMGIFDRLIIKVLEYSRANDVKFEREVWDGWQNIYSQLK